MEEKTCRLVFLHRKPCGRPFEKGMKLTGKIPLLTLENKMRLEYDHKYDQPSMTSLEQFIVECFPSPYNKNSLKMALLGWEDSKSQSKYIEILVTVMNIAKLNRGKVKVSLKVDSSDLVSFDNIKVSGPDGVRIIDGKSFALY